MPWSAVLANLPDLKADARSAVHMAYERAVGALIEGVIAGRRELVETEERAHAGNATALDRLHAFQSAQQTETAARIEASFMLFDAIANEYSTIDAERRTFVDRLQRVAMPAIRASLPIQDVDKAISDALIARAMYWGAQGQSNIDMPTRERRRPGRPAKFPEELKRQALKIKLDGATNSECAKLLYGTKHPSDQQVRNIPSILRNYRKTSSLKRKNL